MSTPKKVYEFEIQYMFPDQMRGDSVPLRWLKALNVDTFPSLEAAQSALSNEESLKAAYHDGFRLRVVKREKVPEEIVYEIHKEKQDGNEKESNTSKQN